MKTSKLRGLGPETAKIIFIADMPEDDDALFGQLLTGKAGQKLTSLLHSVGIPKTSVHITTVLREHARYAKDMKSVPDRITFLAKKHPFVTPEYEEDEAALFAHLSTLRSANVFVPLGNIALFALTRLYGTASEKGKKPKSAIENYRGSILSTWPGLENLSTKKVIPTLNPAGVNKNFISGNYIRADLQRIRKDANTKELNLPVRELFLEPTFEEMILYIKKAQKSKTPIGFDIETQVDEIRIGSKTERRTREMTHFSIALTPENVMCFPLYEDRKSLWSLEQESLLMVELGKFLEDPSVMKVGQNLIFDFTRIYLKYGIRIETFEDTMVSMNVLRPDYRKSLGFIGSLYTREPFHKEVGKAYYLHGLGNAMAFRRYSALDSAVTLESWFKLEKQLISSKNHPTYRRGIDIVPSLIFMMTLGIPVDVPAIHKALAESKVILSDMKAEILKLTGGVVKNPASPKQVSDYFYGTLGIKPIKSKGHISTDVTALKKLARNEESATIASLMLNFRRIHKESTTYLAAIFDKDERWRMQFSNAGTLQGRLASEKSQEATGGNSQNIPDDIKFYLKSDLGYVGYNKDLARAENMVVAHIAPDSVMLKAFSDGIDLHAMTGVALVEAITGERVSYEEIKRQDDEDIFCPLGQGNKSWRFWAKKVNHASNYGMGPVIFSIQNEVPLAQAKIVLANHLKTYPGIQKYRDWVTREVYDTRTLVNLFGRRRYTSDRLNTHTIKSMFSFIPQSTVGDLINEWALIYITENQKLFKELQLLNQVHDSINFQLPLSMSWEQQAEILLALDTSMSQPLHWKNDTFSIGVDTMMGLNMKKLTSAKIDNFKDPSKLALHLEESFETLER